MARPLVAFACLLLLALCACGDGEDKGGASNNGANNSANNNAANNAGNNAANNNAAVNNAGGPCDDDAACEAGQVCDTEAGLCRRACAQDEDCSASAACGPQGFCVSLEACDAQSPCTQGQTCDTCAGRCVRAQDGARPCQSDVNCLFEEFCHPCLGVCQVIGMPCDPCTEDFACGGEGNLCLDLVQGGRVCGAACGDASDCPRGFACQEVGGAKQCVPSSGDCARPGECEEDTDCPVGMRCGPLLSCVAGCTEGTCPNGEVCDAGSCKPPCAGNEDCPPGAECQPDGLCKIPGGCLTSRDCPDAGTYCDLDQQMCVSGCVIDADCPGLQICEDNACQPRPCDGNYLCAFGQVCDIPNGTCMEAQGPFCDPCDAEAENQCGGAPNQCLRFQDDEGNALGDFCAPACDPTSPDACPVGYTCSELQDQDGNPMGAVCTRACYRDPV